MGAFKHSLKLSKDTYFALKIFFAISTFIKKNQCLNDASLVPELLIPLLIFSKIDSSYLFSDRQQQVIELFLTLQKKIKVFLTFKYYLLKYTSFIDGCYIV